MSRSSKWALLTLCAIACNPSFGIDHVMGPGAVYPIAEEDALKEIERRGAESDVEAYVNKTPRSEWSVWSGHPLPEASKSQVRRFVPWHTLEFDITGPQGEVVYPKGFTFNPLEYIPLMPGRFVFIKLNQLEEIKPMLKPGDQVIADHGDVVEASHQHDINISLLDERTARRLGVNVLPSFVERKGSASFLTITEVAADEL